MSGILDTLGSAFGGSLIGGVAAAFSKWQEAKLELAKMQLKIEHDKTMNAHELALQQLSSNVELAKLEYVGLDSSINADKATYSVGSTSKFLVFVDGVRGLVRPVLTATLLIYCMSAMYYLTSTYEVELSQTQVYNLVSSIVDNLVVCSGVALSWWFGARVGKKSGGNQ